ncbi:MAG: alpha-mannosidase [Armatimonadetes bacterium]|nr:alpha-mannosidase [Armatimonadota bacterium]
MLKHPDITRRRIASFQKYELADQIIADSRPLAVEMLDGKACTYEEALKGSWKPVEKGFRYGPAYETFWFRVTGSVPAEWKGLDVAIRPEVGGERTWYKDGVPYQGIDGEHELVRWNPASKISMVLEVISRNPQARVHGKEPPRDALTETMNGAEIVLVRRGLEQLWYDFDFASNLLDQLDPKDPGHATILRGLNDAINVFQGTDESIERARKIIKEALNSLDGDLKHTVFAVGHSHLDTAWLWPIRVTEKKMAHTAASQLRLMERYEEYVFAHSQASQYEWIEKQHPKLFAEIKAAVKRGQWEPVGSMWVEADCNLPSGESLVRQFLYGRKYFREKLGVETEDMWLPDVFGYSAALPQILAKFGIRAFLTQKISWNQSNRFPHNTFWWQGIDGTRMWSHFPPADTYIGNCEPKEILHSVKNHQDHARSDHSLYLFGWGDGGGGPTERHLEFLRRARNAPNYPILVTGRKASDFFREARAKSRDLAVWVGELYLEFHRGTYTSQAANKKANRECEFLLRDAEWLSSFCRDLPKQYPAAELEQAWKLVLLNQFHDIIPGSSVHEVYEDSAKDYAQIRATGEKIIENCLTRIAQGLDSSAMENPIALFHNSRMASQAEVPWTEDWAPLSIECEGDAQPVQLIETFGERKLIFATPEPALGTVTLAEFSGEPAPVRHRLKASGSTRRLENHEISVRFDSNGNIVSIQSLEDRTEFIEQGKLANLFQLFEDKPLFWSAWDIDIFAFEKKTDLIKAESFEIIERGPVRVAAEVVRRFGNSTIRQVISLGPTPGIRFDTEIDWHEEDKLLKVAFPLNVNASRATYEIQYGNVERPTHFNTTWDLAKFEVCAQKWADISEGDMGVALLNDGKYGHDARGNVLRLSLLRAPKAPDPECDMGLHRFTYCLYPHFGNLIQAEVVKAAYALNAPVRVVSLKPGNGENGTLPPLVECNDDNIVVEAVKLSEDAKGIIVRLYECHNTRGQAEVTCARPFSRAFLCDLEENLIDGLEADGKTVQFDYKPFEIITLKLML